MRTRSTAVINSTCKRKGERAFGDRRSSKGKRSVLMILLYILGRRFLRATRRG